MAVTSTNLINYKLVASGSILDVYKDEDILVSDNITGLFDIGTLPADFSRTIMLPGTKRNNAFFEHVYDISIDSPFLFSTNTKVPAYLDFDGIYLVDGYIQLNKVNIKENVGIESYEVSVYGLVSSFSRDINRYYLTDLTNLSVYNHTASLDNISGSWNGNLFGGDIVYPMADYGSGFVYSAGEDFFGIDSNEGGLTVQNYKPAIRVKKVWDAIFDKFGYTYTGSFWNQPFLDDVYMVCNYGLKYPEFAGVDLETYGLARIGPITGSGTDLVIASGSTPTRLAWYNTLNDPGNFIGDNGSYLIGSNNSDVRGLLNLELQVSGAFGMPTTVNLHYWPTGSTPSGAGSGYTTLVNINKYFTDVANAKIAEGSTSGINQKFSVQTEFKTSTLTKNTFYYFGLAYYNGFVSTIKVISDPGGTTKSFLELKEQLAAADGRIMEIPLNMPFGTNGIKLVDWIKGIQKKFNLIIYPNKTKPGQMIVETFNEWYNKGVRKDFNKYINLNNNISVVPANNLAVNKLSFGDALDGDYLALQFSKKQNRNFGTAYYVDTENFFSQGDLKVETTFGVSPLAYIAGTGLSGSVGGLNPSVTQYLVGTIQISPKPAGADTCASINYLPLYTSTGYITTGLTLYIDQYGNNSLFGVRSVTDNNTFETYDVDYTTGVIGYGSGYFC